MENENRNRKAKKISGIVLSSVLFAATAVGAGFGYAKTVNTVGGVDTTFNDYVRIETNVSFKNKEKDINDAAKSVSKTLDFLGMQNANVQTVGKNKLVITNPISSFTYDNTDGYDILNDPTTHFKTMADNNSDYLTEALSLAVPLFLDGTLDIRDTEGDAAFLLDDSTGINRWVFDGGINNGGQFGVADSTDTTSATLKSSNPFDDYVAPTNFFSGAKLTHSNGLPVIELQIDKKGNNSDEYINMFKDLNSYLSENSGTEYVVWFNYEFTYRLVELIDPSALSSDTTLYSFVTSNTNLRPLYLTNGTTTLMDSKYEDIVKIKGNFTDKQATYFVDKINNSGYFDFTDQQFIVVTNLQTKVMLITLAALLLLIILIVIFAFVAYFGLLGLIAAAVFLLTTIIMGLLFASTGILITGLGLVALGVISLASAMILWSLLNIYKNNNEDKFHSINKVAFDKFVAMHSTMFTPVVTLILLFYGAGLIVAPIVATSLYLVVIGMVVAYLFASAILFPIIYGMDALLKFTREENNSNWDYLVGFNLNKNLNIKAGMESNRKTSIIGVIISVLIIAAGIIVGGTLFGVTGSAVNSNIYGTQDYAYQVQVVNESSKLTLGTPSDTLASKYKFGNEKFETYYNAVNDNTENVNAAFKDNGIKVSRADIVRFDELSTNDSGDRVIIGSFGYEVYSKDKLTSDKLTAINDELAKENVAVINDEMFDIVTTFQITNGSSYIDGTSSKMIGYSENNAMIKGIYGLLIMVFIVSLILVFVGNLGIALASLISTLMESAMLLSPIIILFIPFSGLVVFPIILLAGLSFRNKVVITKDAKNDEIETGKWNRAAKKQQLSLPIFAGVLLVLESFLFGTFAWTAVLPMIIVTLLAPISIYLIQQLVFPYLAELLGGTRERRLKQQLQKDIARTKNKKQGEIMEEYIEGVNM